MTKLVLGAALFGAMAWSTAALAQPQAQPAPTNTATTVDANKQVICASTYHNGMLIQRPTCMTKDLRQTTRLQNQQDLRDMQSKALTSNNPN